MPDLSLSVGLGVDTAAYEQGIARAEALLAQLSGDMTSAVAQVEALSAGVAAAWQDINGSILQAVEQAGRLAAMSAAPTVSVGGQAAAGLSAGVIEQAVARAMSGVSVNLNGEAVGALVAPSVNCFIANETRGRRFSVR